jgi:hypothetical protein
MHCPNCGTKTSTEHKYCRSCGLSLEKFALLLAEELPAGELGRAEVEELTRLAARERRIVFWLTAAAALFIACVVGAVLYGIIGKIIIEKGHVFGGLVFLLVILLPLAFGGLFLYRESLQKKMQKRLEPALPRGEKTGRLLPDDARFEPVPSVTERTTELLSVEKSRRKAESRRQLVGKENRSNESEAASR